MSKIAVYPGSFDPISLGHLNIIRRASRLFDELIVCVAINSAKNPMFTLAERMDFVRRVTARFPNVRVDSSDQLVVSYCRAQGAGIIVRGLRAMTDFENEFQMAMTNSKIEPTIETVFLASSEKYTYLSSTVVKEMGRYGADLSKFVPREILAEVTERTLHRR